MIKLLKLLILILLLIPAHLLAQEIQGFIYESPGDKPIGNANIIISGTDHGTVSGSDGYFLLKIPETGQVTIVVSHIGYKSLIITQIIPATGSEKVIFRLIPHTSEIVETVITATRTKRNINEVPASVRLITAGQIMEMPSAAIDDLLRTEASIIVDRKNGIFSKTLL